VPSDGDGGLLTELTKRPFIGDSRGRRQVPLGSPAIAKTFPPPESDGTGAPRVALDDLRRRLRRAP